MKGLMLIVLVTEAYGCRVLQSGGTVDRATLTLPSPAVCFAVPWHTLTCAWSSESVTDHLIFTLAYADSKLQNNGASSKMEASFSLTKTQPGVHSLGPRGVENLPVFSNLESF